MSSRAAETQVRCAAGFISVSRTMRATIEWVRSRVVPPAPTAANGAETDEVQRLLRLGKPTVVEFGANACASCREMKPVLTALRRKHGDRIAVVEVDLIAQRAGGYIQRYGIQLMPTQVFFDASGRETGRHMGTISGAEILARLQGGAP